MKPITKNDIKSELSYALLHAIASHAGAGCKIGTRHDDNHGIDAVITAWEVGTEKDEIDVKVQLKATADVPTVKDGYLSYFLAESKPNTNKRYNELRAVTKSTYRILVVLFLPQDETEWLSITADSLILKKCAYWVSLRGAGEPSPNATGQTVYLPESQIFDLASLQTILQGIQSNTLNYRHP